MMFEIANLLQLSLIDVTYPVSMRIFGLFLVLVLTSCNSGIYTRDGVTDGDTFFLAPTAFADDDPAFQSWVTYSLIKSACQLEIGGENPARASSFECELKSRRHLATAWDEKRQLDQSISDHYLDALSEVQYAGFLAEYTLRYFGRKGWETPDGLRTHEFRAWQRQHLVRHRPKTRIVGSWNYRDATIRAPY